MNSYFYIFIALVGDFLFFSLCFFYVSGFLPSSLGSELATATLLIFWPYLVVTGLLNGYSSSGIRNNPERAVQGVLANLAFCLGSFYIEQPGSLVIMQAWVLGLPIIYGFRYLLCVWLGRGSTTSPALKREDFYSLKGKRAFDLCIAICLCVLASPLFVGILVFQFLTTGSSPFYKSARAGFGGRTFYCWKFKTMVDNSNDILAHILATDEAAKNEWETTFKLKHDPRITKVGSFLRKTSLDELPQLYNVILGEMSLVGPRPVYPEELERFDNSNQIAYKEMRPGMTGIWQLYFRSTAPWRSRVKATKLYHRRYSFLFDLKLLILTPAVLIGSRKAV